MYVSEKFVSIEGEGINQGYPSLFVRFAGCNLNCSFCDTSYAQSKNGAEELSPENVLEWALEARLKTGISRITLTGGEPLHQSYIDKLMSSLLFYGFDINLETNGSYKLTEYRTIIQNPMVTVVMDYKLPSSGEENRMVKTNLRMLAEKDVLKFVCQTECDLLVAKRILNMYQPESHVYFSPVYGKLDPKLIVEFLLENKLHYCRVQLQLHKQIWGADKRCV